MSTSIGPALHSSLFVPELAPRKKDSALLELARRARQAGLVREAERVHAALLARERHASSAVGRGVAIPNVRSVAVLEPGLVVGRCRKGMEWGAADGEPVHLVVLALSPAETSVVAHHEFLARIAAVVRHARPRQKLLEATDVDTVAALLREAIP